MSTVIKVENVSKLYRLGNVTAETFKEDILKLWANIKGKEDPSILLAETNDRTQKGSSKYVWALKDVGFEVKEGEVLGVIGRNGAGKSTLLKILSKVTAPTRGNIKVRGRIASLLEVGTGFHPELTGKENMYLNGHILGMTKKEIDKKFDEIVDFAGVEKYLETPVKRYSSGMYVRLAFAVAAHLEPEILIVDEVLAVGDAEFQKKCLGKMNEVSKKDGRTILFVSHNIHSIKSLCQKGVYLRNGMVSEMGDIEQVVNHYVLDNIIKQEYEAYSNSKGNHEAYVRYATCLNSKGEEKFHFSADEPIFIKLEIAKPSAITGIYGHIAIKTSDETIIIETDTKEQQVNQLDTDRTGIFYSVVQIPRRILKTGDYFISLGLASIKSENFQIESLPSFLKFEVVAEKTPRDISRSALISTILEWNFDLHEEQIVV